jgi:hypothetical protein
MSIPLIHRYTDIGIRCQLDLDTTEDLLATLYSK